jgi:hypothetical protein
MPVAGQAAEFATDCFWPVAEIAPARAKRNLAFQAIAATFISRA